MSPTALQNPQPDSPTNRLNRRTIISAAAWAAPVIAATVASPAAATSLGTITAVTITPIAAGAPKTSVLQLNPSADNVPVTLAVEPQGIVSWKPDSVISSTGMNGRLPIEFSTEVAEAQTVVVTATAPGYAPLSFPLAIEATAPVEPGTISFVSGPTSISTDTSPSDLLTLRVNPPVEGVKITLSSPMLTFSPTDLTTDASGQFTFTMSTVYASPSITNIVASAPEYDDLTIPIQILPPADSAVEPIGKPTVWISGYINLSPNGLLDGHTVFTGNRGSEKGWLFALAVPFPEGEDTVEVTAEVHDLDGNPSVYQLDAYSWTMQRGYSTNRTVRTINAAGRDDIAVLTLKALGGGCAVYFG